ncbi:hypothetical protein ELH97_12780 [Rhizobium leguminosarum]|jgi:hypothetical protein|nr:hypothetical protein ELH97_12780 [Rhizobium leguminosarum]
MAENGLDLEAKRFSLSKDNYDLLVTMLDQIDQPSKDVVIDFVKYYDIIKTYDRHIYKVMQELSLRHEERIILFPLRRKNNNVTKSGDAILYDFKAIATVEFPEKFVFRDSPFNQKMLSSGLPKYAVDDFVGTGEQFLSMFDEMVAEYAKVSLQGVACVVAMRGGAQRLREGGFHVAASELKDRAIADYLTNAGRDTAACYAIYDKMEASLQVDAVDQRGRNASEALLSLKRTPNNTLPIFWSLGKDKKWPAPFKRA